MSPKSSDYRYVVKQDVAKRETALVAHHRYKGGMLAQWVRDAIEHAGISGAELARRLTQKLGRSIDRAAVNKMMLLHETERTKRRKVSADEMMAIAEITGFAPPSDEAATSIGVPLISWVSAGAMETPEVVQEMEDAPRIYMADLDPDGEWIALEIPPLYDSMDRISPPESKIIVNLRDRRLVSNACYVIADAETGEATYKRYRNSPPRWEPVSTNPVHEPMYLDEMNGEPRIIGRVRRSVLDM